MEEIFDREISSEGGLAHSEISRSLFSSDIKPSDRGLFAEVRLGDSEGSRIRLEVDPAVMAVGADMVVPGKNDGCSEGTVGDENAIDL